jgi:hypothetical protein
VLVALSLGLYLSSRTSAHDLYSIGDGQLGSDPNPARADDARRPAGVQRLPDPRLRAQLADRALPSRPKTRP